MKAEVIQLDNQSLAHTKYNCTYHIVFIPKYRRKALYGKYGKEMGEILSMVCRITGVELLKGGVCPDHIHMYVAIPPKMSLSNVMSKIKGKSALMFFDKHPECRDKYGRHFWARGYYAETIGQVNEDTIKKYIEEQEECSRIEG